MNIRNQLAFGGLPTWALSPYFNIPTDALNVTVGESVTIYGDSLINVAIKNNLNVIYTSDIGVQSGKNYIVSTISANVGSHPVLITFYSESRKYHEVTINIEVVEKVSFGSKKILVVGDSTTYISEIAPAIDAVLTGVSLSYIGTIGTTYKCEGYSGSTWYGFIHGLNGKFVKNSVVDIPAYFTDNSIDTPDYIYVRLGLNETFPTSAILGDGFTDAEITLVLGYAKTLIDAFLSFDANLKIILGIPTICENSGAGWNTNYDEAIYSQDLFIKNIHKYWGRLIAEFNNGIYNPRVDCSFEAIYLDRNDGYPKTGGIHTNGIHFATSGRTQIGQGLSFAINKELRKSFSPTGLAVTWINDYAQITWDDNTGGLAQYEIWESKNGAEFSLVATTIAGATSYNNYTWQNAAMAFKVVAKYGDWTSLFSDTATINTPIVLKTDQSTINNVVFSTINISSGKTISISWGDGSNANYTGNNANVTKTYGATQNPYFIAISGDINSITSFSHTNAKTYGDCSKWIFPTSMITFKLASPCSGNINTWTLSGGLTTFDINGNKFTGDMTGLVIPIGMTSINNSPAATFKQTGDLSTTLFPIGLTRFYIPAQGYSKLPRGEFKNFDSTIGLYASFNLLSIAELDAYLVDIMNYFSTTNPVKNSLFKFDGTSSPIPSATGLAAKAAIEAKFIEYGFVATIQVKS